MSVALAGALTKVKASFCGGESVSLAIAVMATVWPTLTIWLAIGASVGSVLDRRKLALKLSIKEVLSAALLCAHTARPT